MKMKVEGMDNLNRVLRSVPANGRRAANAELRAGAEHIRGESAKRAPVDTGHLRGSSYATFGDMEAEIGFTAPYAMRQHENMQYNHKSGGAKYLENPVKEFRDKLIKNIGRAIKKAVT